VGQRVADKPTEAPVEKKSAEKLANPGDRLNWDPWTTMAELGYPQEAMTEEAGTTDPGTYTRLMPLLERYRDNPAVQQMLLRANQLANESTKGYLEHGGHPEDPNLFTMQRLRQFLSPAGTVLDPRNMQQGYEAAVQGTANTIYSQLVQEGADPAEALSQAQSAARRVVGAPEDFQKRLADAAINRPGSVGGLSLGDIKGFTWLGGAPLGLAAALTEGLGSKSFGALRGNQEDQQALQDAMQSRLERDALNNDFGYGLKNVLWDAPVSGIFGSMDTGTSEMGAGLEKLRTLGTAQNRLLAERHADRARKRRSYEQAQAAGAPPLDPTSYGSAVSAAKERWARRDLPKDMDAWDRAEQAATDPYRNLATFDPLTGEMSAFESGRASRKWHPGEWGGMLRDWLTGSDTSHDFMMRGQDTAFDDPGYGRYDRYQAMTRAAERGKGQGINTLHANLRHLPIAEAGEEFGQWDPRRLLGWRSGARSGADPTKVLENWQKGSGRDIASGMLSARDVTRHMQNIGDNPMMRKALESSVDKWYENRGLGDDTVRWLDSYVPPRQPAQPEKKTGAARDLMLPAVQRWAKTAADPDWYRRYEGAQSTRRGYSLDDFYRYQTRLAEQFRDRLRYGQLQGHGLTEDEFNYGEGFRRRWKPFAKGHFSNNFWAPFSPLLSKTDKQKLDPVLSAQRAAIARGEWQPGMQLDPLITRSDIGWLNPLGRISEYLGLRSTADAQRRELAKQVMASGSYKKLREDLRKGLIKPKTYTQLAPGLPDAQYDPTLRDDMTASAVANAGNTVRRFAKLVNDTDKSWREDRPYTAVRN
jgi:hypothetical protein